jgi:L-cysteine/cystine lyase
MARLLGSKDSDDVSILPNASFGLIIGIVLKDLKCHDVVLTSDHEHPSVKKPLEKLRQKGIKVIEISANSEEDFLNHLKKQMACEKPRLIIISHVSYKDGRIFPIEQIGEIAKWNDVSVIVDGAQAVGQVKITLEDFPPSMYVFSGHKMLCGPMGTGGLWADRKFLATHGNVWASWTTKENNGQHPFEVGTLNLGLIAGLEAAIDDYLLNQIYRHNTLLELKGELLFSLSKVEELRPLQWNGKHAPGIISFQLPNGMNSKHFAHQLLSNYGIAVKPFEETELKNGIRISLNHEIKEREIKNLVRALSKSCSTGSSVSFS